MDLFCFSLKNSLWKKLAYIFDWSFFKILCLKIYKSWKKSNYLFTVELELEQKSRTLRARTNGKIKQYTMGASSLKPAYFDSQTI